MEKESCMHACRIQFRYREILFTENPTSFFSFKTLPTFRLPPPPPPLLLLPSVKTMHFFPFRFAHTLRIRTKTLHCGKEGERLFLLLLLLQFLGTPFYFSAGGEGEREEEGENLLSCPNNSCPRRKGGRKERNFPNGGFPLPLPTPQPLLEEEE